MIELSIIVVQYGNLEYLYSLLHSLEGHPDEEIIFEMVVVNNGKWIQKNKKKELENICSELETVFVKNDDESYSSAINQGVQKASSDLIILANNDIEWVENESLFPAIHAVDRGKSDIVSPQLIYPDRSQQQSYHEFHSIKKVLSELLIPTKIKSNCQKNSSSGIYPVHGYIIGAFMIMRKSTFVDLNGFDERFEFYGEDVDFCYRAKCRGYSLAIHPQSKIIHVGGGSSNENKANYVNKLYQARRTYLDKHYTRPYVYIYIILKFVVLVERLLLYLILSIISGDSAWEDRVGTFKKEIRGFRGML